MGLMIAVYDRDNAAWQAGKEAPGVLAIEIELVANSPPDQPAGP